MSLSLLDSIKNQNLKDHINRVGEIFNKKLNAKSPHQ